MVSTNTNPWQDLHEQLMQMDDRHRPSAPKANVEHWFEFDVEILLDCSTISIGKIQESIVITGLSREQETLRLFDVILSINEIELKSISRDKAQCLLDLHQGKRITMRLRRLQPSTIESIDLKNIPRSKRLGFHIDQWKKSDFGLFVIGIKAKGLAANQGQLRIGDRLLQMSNELMTINLQCIQLDKALKLIERMKKESTQITLLVAR